MADSDSKKNKPFRISNYLLMPQDVIRGLSKAGLFDVNGVLILVIGYLVLSWFVPLSSTGIVFILLLCAVLYWHVDVRYVVAAALVCLGSVPVLFYLYTYQGIFRAEQWAEQMTVWGFYFVLMAIISAVWSFIRYTRQKHFVTSTRDTTTLSVKSKSSPSKHTVTDVR